MLDFRRADFSDFEGIKAIVHSFDELSCELSEINLLLWQNIYSFEFCIYDNMLFTKNCVDGVITFGIPFSRDIEKAINILRRYCTENNLTLKFFAVQGERLRLFKEKFGNGFNYQPVRDSFEYIYDRQALAQLVGKKYHSKRNHISGFMKKYNWKYERLSEQNVDDVKLMLSKWYEDNGEKQNENMRAEQIGLFNILDNKLYNKYIGGILKVDDRVVAFTLGCKINDNVFDVNIEKALSEFEGAYAMINNIFVSAELDGFKYVNREEDMGIEGLRKAKLSYRPIILLEKYVVTEEA